MVPAQRIAASADEIEISITVALHETNSSPSHTHASLVSKLVLSEKCRKKLDTHSEKANISPFTTHPFLFGALCYTKFFGMEKRALPKTCPKDVLDFSRPWDFSDAVLLVEGKRFHVHRSILAMWSPVFSRMFTSDFKEKTAPEIPLPEKKSSEIKEMLLVIYPTSAKQINGDNYLFLLNLAEEYMMKNLSGKCEEYLTSCLRRPHKSPLLCLDLLDIAQHYRLEQLQMECTDKAQSISFKEVKNHPIYSKINFPNFRKIVEGRIQRMGEEMTELLKKCKDVESHASSALNNFDEIVSFLVEKVHSRSKNRQNVDDYDSDDTEEKLEIIGDSRKSPFYPLEGPLSDLHADLQAIQQYAKCSKTLKKQFR